MKEVCLQRLGIGIFGNGRCQILQRRTERVIITPAGVLAMINDKHFRDGASTALRARERLVVDHQLVGNVSSDTVSESTNIGSVEPTDSKSPAGSLATWS